MWQLLIADNCGSDDAKNCHCNAKKIQLECLKFSHVGLYLEPVLTSHGGSTQILLDYHHFSKPRTHLTFLNSGRILDFFLSKHRLSPADAFVCWGPTLHMRVLEILCSMPRLCFPVLNGLAGHIIPASQGRCRELVARETISSATKHGWGKLCLLCLVL